MTSFFKTIAGAAAAVFLLGGSVLAETYHGLNNVAPKAGFSDVDRAYPDMNEKYVRYGKSMNLAKIRRVKLSQSRDDVTRILGKPVTAANDGSLYFVINLPYLKSSQFVCQYRVFFDSDEVVSATVWRRPQCANLVTGKLK